MNTYKTYKELVTALSLPDYTNNTKAKKRQLAKLSQTYTIVQHGRSFTLTPCSTPHIYSLSSMEEKGITPTFLLLVNALLLNELHHHYYFTEESKFILNKRQLAYTLGFVNSRYNSAFYEGKKLADQFKVPYKFVIEFFENVTKSYSSIIDSSVKHLSELGIIATQEAYYGKRVEQYDGFNDISSVSTYGKLSDKEVELYIKCVNDFLTLHNVTLKEVYFGGKREEYYKYINEFMEREVGIINITKKLEIFFDNEYINRVLNDENISYEEVFYLNDKFINKQLDNYRRRNKGAWGDMKEDEYREKVFRELCRLFLDRCRHF